VQCSTPSSSASSSAICSAPQSGFSRDICSMNLMCRRAIGGRPGPGFDRPRQWRRNPSRCHRSTVSGVTTKRADLQPFHWRRSPIQKDPVAPSELGAFGLPLVDVDLLSRRCHLKDQVTPESKAVSQARQPVPEESQRALLITHDRTSVKHQRFSPGAIFAEHGYRAWRSRRPTQPATGRGVGALTLGGCGRPGCARQPTAGCDGARRPARWHSSGR
jgi:hypothetical protein